MTRKQTIGHSMVTYNSSPPGESQANWHRAIFARSEDVVRRDVAGETILVPLTSSGAADVEYLYRMNAVGTAVWDALDGRCDALGIVEILFAQFNASGDVSREDIERDVQDFLNDLQESGLASRVEATHEDLTD